jgi:hypothetical protein
VAVVSLLWGSAVSLLWGSAVGDLAGAFKLPIPSSFVLLPRQLGAALLEIAVVVTTVLLCGLTLRHLVPLFCLLCGPLARVGSWGTAC